MLLPAVTGSGVSTFVTPTSMVAALTVVVAVPVLFWAFVSPVVVAVALLVMVPVGVAALTLTTNVKVAVAAGASVAVVLVAVIVPVPPAAGAFTVQPVGATKETNVVFVGTTSARLMLPA